tara:strand:+ start:1619 stop:1795 length:177 start_codon:yes stop_codon:yes gene_type:complete
MKTEILMLRRHSKSATQVKALESNQLTKSSFQATNPPKLRTKAQASSEPTPPTQTKAL